jgi:hypothetical protein
MRNTYKSNNILRYTSKWRIPFFLFFSIEGQILPLTGADGLWYNNKNERRQVLGMAEINIYETTLNHNGEQGIIDFNVLLKAFQNAGITINVFNIWDNPSLMTEVRPVEQVLLQEGVEAMPITVVGGEIWKKGAYPDYSELMMWSAKTE